MSANKALIPKPSAFSRHRSFGYETQKELRLDNQALILDFRR